MSEQVNKETDILLPSAGVDLFIRDAETTESAKEMGKDWRFARVNVNVREGGVESAIKEYQLSQSPALVIIETDTTDESFIAHLETLSRYCAEGTNAVVIGPVNDVNLYRSLTSMGVSDYLVRPVPKDVLSEVVAKALVCQLGASGSRLIGVIGSKGGVGASVLAQALALGVSEKLGEKTFLLDAAGGWSSLGVGMGFEPSGSLHEAVRAAVTEDEDTLKRMLFSANDKLSVLASGSESMLEPSVQAQQYEALLDMVMALYPVVLVDLSGSIPSLKRTIINRVHELIVVSTPTLASLRAARSLFAEVKALRDGSDGGLELILNMQGMAPGKEVPKADIKAALDRDPSVLVPFDPKLFLGLESEGKQITSDKAGMQIVETLLPLARKLIVAKGEGSDEKAETSGFLGQFIGKLKK
ncbi:MAG: AAA family ATPase [Rhodospirillales bacterium]|nr:AAA family ATPase [Alphaproteobacteria bacterium]USO04514.1 MAG: AAA family ATPase [Rhodospirillales bacterium]